MSDMSAFHKNKKFSFFSIAYKTIFYKIAFLQRLGRPLSDRAGTFLGNSLILTLSYQWSLHHLHMPELYDGDASWKAQMVVQVLCPQSEGGFHLNYNYHGWPSYFSIQRTKMKMKPPCHFQCLSNYWFLQVAMKLRTPQNSYRERTWSRLKYSHPLIWLFDCITCFNIWYNKSYMVRINLDDII